MPRENPVQAVRKQAVEIERLLGYLNLETQRYVTESVQHPKDWGYAGSLGHARDRLMVTAAGLSGREAESIDDLLGTETAPDESIRLPNRLPRAYEAEDFRRDLLEFHKQIDRRILDGCYYLLGKDYGMAGTMFDDVEDMQRASELLQDGEYDRAAKFIRGWDTIVRDQVPQRLYEVLYRP